MLCMILVYLLESGYWLVVILIFTGQCQRCGGQTSSTRPLTLMGHPPHSHKDEDMTWNPAAGLGQATMVCVLVPANSLPSFLSLKTATYNTQNNCQWYVSCLKFSSCCDSVVKFGSSDNNKETKYQSKTFMELAIMMTSYKNSKIYIY